jgi:hypothetical protein
VRDDNVSESLKARNEAFASCWIGERLPTLAGACLESFSAHGHRFTLYTYGAVGALPTSIEVGDAEAILPRAAVVRAHGGMETAADLFAYRFLERLGGWVVDCDVVCNAMGVPDVALAFAEERSGIINNAVLKFPQGHEAIRALLDYVATIDTVNSPWGATGPRALSAVLGARPDLAGFRLPTTDVYPLHWTETPKLLFPEFRAEVLRRTSGSPFIHLWGSALREIGFDCDLAQPPEGSYLDLLYSRYLEPGVRAALRPVDDAAFRGSVQDYTARHWGVSYFLR